MAGGWDGAEREAPGFPDDGTWDVVAVTRAQRARARRQGEYLPGTVVHQALRTRAQARAIARRLVEVADE